MNIGDLFVDPEEGRRLFDEAARESVGMSGEESIRRFNAGEFADIPDDADHRNIIELALLIPFGRADDLSEDVNAAECGGDEGTPAYFTDIPVWRQTMASAEPHEYVDEDPLLPEIVYVTPEEGRRMFDEAAREWVGMSGEEFIRRWEAGEFETMPDDEAHRMYVELVLMIPLARQDS